MLGTAAVRRAAVHRHLQPHHAVVAATDPVALATFHHHRVIRPYVRVPHQPAGAEFRVGLLVGGERHFDIHQRPHARGFERAQRQQQRRVRALHVRRAPPVNPTALHHTTERVGVSPLPGYRNHIIVRVDMQRLLGAARGEFTDDIIPRIRLLLRRQVLFHERARDRKTAGFQSGCRQLLG